MSKANKAPFIIFSVFQSSLSWEENIENHLDAYEFLRARHIKAKQVKGVYTHTDGTRVTELSILIHQTNAVRAFQLAHRYNQESILVVDGDRSARLAFLLQGDNVKDNEYLGRFTEVTQAEAMSSQAYTFNQETGAYYVTK